MSSSSSSSEKQFEPSAEEVKVNMEIVSVMTSFVQEKYLKKYERRIQREHEMDKCRQEVAQRYIVLSRKDIAKPVLLPKFQCTLVPVSNPRRLWSNRPLVTRQYVSLDPMDVLVYSRGLACYTLKISTGEHEETHFHPTFEGKWIRYSPDVYREDDRSADVTYFKAASLLYRNHDDRIMAYNCETGLSFYHNGKIVKVNHTSPKSEYNNSISCTIGDDRTKAYYVEKSLFIYRGEYYSYIWTRISAEGGQRVTYVVHVASRSVVLRVKEYESYYVVGDNIVCISSRGTLIMRPRDEEKKPRDEEETPETGDEEPRDEEKKPRDEEETPETGDEEPRDEEKTPETEDEEIV